MSAFAAAAANVVLVLLAITNAIANDSPAKAVSEVDRRLADAYARNDVSTLAGIYAADVTFTTPAGTVLDRSSELELRRSGRLHFDSYVQEATDIRVYRDAAVVTCVAHITGKNPRNNLDGSYRYLRVYVQLNHRWKLVAVEAVRMPQ